MTTEVTLTRTLEAPPESVFRAWTDADHLDWYFSPLPGDRKPIEVDARVGGVWRQWMITGPDTRFFTGGRYLELSPPERLVFAWGADEGWPDFDDNLIVTIELEAVGEQTEMTFTLGLPDEKASEWLELGVREGWSDTIDRLVADFARE